MKKVREYDLIYEKWLKQLIEIISEELEIKKGDIPLKLKFDECRKCYESGMNPFQAFREN